MHPKLASAGRLAFFAALCLAPVPLYAAGKPTTGLRFPSLSKDNKTVVFGYRGDIWAAPVDGEGAVLRLTIHERQDTLARISPDGKWIAFSSARQGNYDIYLMPIEGGTPKQITFHSGAEALCDWSPDGKRLLFVSGREPGDGRRDLYEVDIKGGTPRRLTFDGATEGSYAPDGKSIVYIRGFISTYWDNYKGSANHDIYIADTSGGVPRRVTQTPGNERYPFFSADQKTIYFVSEDKGVANFYAMPSAGGARRQVSKFKGNDVHRPHLSPDRKTVVFERGGKLYTSDLTASKVSARPIKISVTSDDRNSGLEARTITGGGEQVHMSNDGRSLAFVLRGNLWVMPASGGNGVQLTSNTFNDQWPRFSPDGRQIAFFSNRKGNNDLYLLDVASRNVTQLTSHRSDDHFHNWSPDGKSLVFTSERSGNKDIWLLDIASKQSTQLTRHAAADDDPTFAPDGRSIAFDSGRAGNQAIYVMDVDGQNVRRVTTGAGFLQVPCFSPDGRMLVYETFNPAGAGSGGLFVISSKGGPSMRVSRDGSTAYWSPKGDYIYFTANRGRAGNGVFRVHAPENIEQGEHVPFIGRVTVDLKKELGELFDQAWRELGAGFYDRSMHGVNWRTMREKYRAMAIDAENKSEFQNVIRQMLAELGASHLGIYGGNRSGSAALPTIQQNGHLGLELDVAKLVGGGFAVRSLTTGGPADRIGIRIGDVITGLGRTRFNARTNLDKVLAGTIGRDQSIFFRPRTSEGLQDIRRATIRPVSTGAISALNYRNWTRKCVSTVREKGGRDGMVYIHLNAMNPQNLARFRQAVAGWIRNNRVRGMVLDVRNNGGGNIHNELMAILTAKPLARIRLRNGNTIYQPPLFWDRPVVVLTNERSFSDAEVFPHMVKAAKVGKIVGVPTAGGVIGTNNITLADGSTFRIPRSGFYAMDGRNLEGLGIKPDFIVEETPEDRRVGRDTQLAKAIEVLRDEIKTARARPKPKPAAKPKTKPAPKKPAPEVTPTASASTPYTDAKVGDAATYRHIDPQSGEVTILRARVAKVEADRVVIQREIVSGNGTPIRLPGSVPRVHISKALSAFGKFVAASINYKDGKLKATIEPIPGKSLVYYFADDAPVYGIVRVATERGLTVLELQKDDTSNASANKPAPTKTAPAKTAPAKTTPAKAAPAKGEDASKSAPAAPIRDVAVGEWARYRREVNGQTIEWTLRVKEIRGDVVVLSQEASDGAQTQALEDIERPLMKSLAPPANLKAESYGKDKITVNGKSYDCVTMTAKAPDGVLMKWYVHDAIPVFGFLRVEREGQVILELVASGRS